jgi:hypothetical protein
MNTIRVKDLWMRREAFDRLMNKELKGDSKEKIARVGSALRVPYLIYKTERERKWVKLGGMALQARKHALEQELDTMTKNKAWWFQIARTQKALRDVMSQLLVLTDEFNDWAEEAAQEEININVPPCRIEDIPDVAMSADDLCALREIFVIARNDNAI